MKTCYIATPFAGIPDEPRAVLLARLALAMGMAPVVIHPTIRAGDGPEAFARGLDAAKAIAMGCDEAWCLHHDDGTMSDGCRYELLHRRHRGGTWADWQAVARVLHPELLSQVCAAASEPAEVKPRKVAPPWTYEGDDRADRGDAASVWWGERNYEWTASDFCGHRPTLREATIAALHGSSLIEAVEGFATDYEQDTKLFRALISVRCWENAASV